MIVNSIKLFWLPSKIDCVKNDLDFFFSPDNLLRVLCVRLRDCRVNVTVFLRPIPFHFSLLCNAPFPLYVLYLYVSESYMLYYYVQY